MTAQPDLLAVGSPESPGRPAAPWRRRAGGLIGVLAVAVVVALALLQLEPVRWWSTDTGLTLLTYDGNDYLAVSVDTGDTQALPSGRDIADVVGPVRWLSTRPQGEREISGAFPPWTGGREIVGAVGGGLLTLVGTSRVRRIQMWDVGYSSVTADFGTATDVLGVNEREALVTYGCLVLGCPTTLLDLVDGSRTEITPPNGYRLEISALAGDGTIALGVSAQVADPSGAAVRSVVVGRPGDWHVVDDLNGADWDDIAWGPDGWLVVMRRDGDAMVWREGLEPVLVQIPDGQDVRGISALPPDRVGGTVGR